MSILKLNLIPFLLKFSAVVFILSITDVAHSEYWSCGCKNLSSDVMRKCSTGQYSTSKQAAESLTRNNCGQSCDLTCMSRATKPVQKWSCYCVNTNKNCSDGYIHDSREAALKHSKNLCGADCDPNCMWTDPNEKDREDNSQHRHEQHKYQPTEEERIGHSEPPPATS